MTGFRQNIGWLLALFLIGFFVFGFNLNNQFFWDDDDWIINNPNAHSLSWNNIKTVFSTDILHGFGLSSDYYRPLLLLSFAFNWVIGGSSPFGYHLLSNLFHIGSAVLIFLLFLNILNRRAAFLAALFWLIHPLNTEAVTYISGRGDPMSVFFMLLALFLWTNDVEHRYGKTVDKLGWRFPWSRYETGSLTAFALAILSRETAILFPALAAVFYIAFISEEKFWRSVVGAIRATIPFWIVSAVYFILRLTVLNFQNTLNFYSEANIYTENLSYRLFTFSHALIEYFKLLFVPAGLHMERVLPVATSLFQWPVWLGAVIVSGIIWFGFVLYNRNFKIENSLKIENWKFKIKEPNSFRIWFFCWSWFFIALAPVSGIVPINAIMYEHWLYLSLIGIAVLFGYYVEKIFSILKTKKLTTYYVLLTTFLIIYLSFLSVLTIKRNVLWGKPIEFYEDILRYNPDSIRVINNLANIYSDRGDLDRSAELYKQIIESESGRLFAQPYYNLGNIYRDIGDMEKAEELYKQAIEVDPSFPFAYQNLAVAYAIRGEFILAAEMLEKAKELRPAEPLIYYNLAIIYNAYDKNKLALENIQKGLGLARNKDEITAFEQLRDEIIK